MSICTPSVQFLRLSLDSILCLRCYRGVAKHYVKQSHWQWQKSLFRSAEHTVQAAKLIQKTQKTRILTYADPSVAWNALKPRLCSPWSFVVVETQKTWASAWSVYASNWQKMCCLPLLKGEVLGHAQGAWAWMMSSQNGKVFRTNHPGNRLIRKSNRNRYLSTDIK